MCCKICNFANNKDNTLHVTNKNFNKYYNEKKKIADITGHQSDGLHLCRIMLFYRP